MRYIFLLNKNATLFTGSQHLFRNNLRIYCSTHRSVLEELLPTWAPNFYFHSKLPTYSFYFYAHRSTSLHITIIVSKTIAIYFFNIFLFFLRHQKVHKEYRDCT